MVRSFWLLRSSRAIQQVSFGPVRISGERSLALPPGGAWRLHWPGLAGVRRRPRRGTPGDAAPTPNWPSPPASGDVPIAGTFLARQAGTGRHETTSSLAQALSRAAATATATGDRRRGRACSHPTRTARGREACVTGPNRTAQPPYAAAAHASL
jgi:hypothetical protein